ncbi:ATP-grasp enzyme [Nocardioides mangrovicus]|uniref:ATP-grasp enzyme n=2 Tax=Nocardioides mangrovicus TaxID=2478913 RepID=A0A3L8NZI9_9ACTN|nr:ATP-grasp enzyme [Nocardioides mangrovicus]
MPANLALTSLALLLGGRDPQPSPEGERLTILISGGKMTKALTLARAFHRAGHRVVLVEQEKYRWTGHRFSRCVDVFRTVPRPQDPGYAEALLDVVRQESVDVYVPVCSPVASYHDAAAAPLLEAHCRVIHADAETIKTLDDKEALAALAAGLGLSVPDAHRMTSPEQVAAFDFASADPPYVLKSIAYDPVNRLDLTPLPRPTPEATAAFARSKPITAETPWVMQHLVEGVEYCTHSTVVEGRIQVWACCPSSAFQVNYAMVDKPEILAWVRGLVEPLGLTGQISFDVMQTPDGRVLPIECNPRTHSAITMFYDHPDLAEAYLGRREEPVVPTVASRPTYWAYHEAWRLLRAPGSWRERWRTVREGVDAVFDPRDPLPFLMLHHLQIPALLLQNLVAGRDWVKIDFNIGKLVEPAGD